MDFTFTGLLKHLLERFARTSPVYRATLEENAKLRNEVTFFEGQRRLFGYAREALEKLSRKYAETSAMLKVVQAEVETYKERAKATQTQVVALNNEYSRVERDFRDLQTGKVTLKQMAVRDGKLTAEFGTEMAALLASQFHAMLEQVGADNYIEMQFVDGTDPEKKVIVLIQRTYGKSPHQLRQEAEAEVVQLRGRLDLLGS